MHMFIAGGGEGEKPELTWVDCDAHMCSICSGPAFLFVCFCFYLFFLLTQTLRFIKNLFHDIRGEKQKQKKTQKEMPLKQTLCLPLLSVG